MLSEVYSSFEPLFILSSMTGLFFFKINFETSSVSVSISSKIISFFALITLIFANISCSYFNTELVRKMFSVKFSKYSGPIFVLVNNLISISSMIWIFIKRDEIMKILIKLNEIDEILDHLGIYFDYRKQKMKLLIFIGILEVILLIMGIISSVFFIQQYESVDFRFLTLIFNMILYSIIIILVLHYITFMCNIGTRFELLNLCIEKSIENLPKIHLKI